MCSIDITEQIRSSFKENGVVCLRNVFSSDWVEKVANGIEFNIASPSIHGEFLRNDEESGAYFDDYCNWKRIPEFEDFVFHSPAAEIAGILMDSKYSVFYHEHVLNKEPGTSKRTPWHHDQPYYPFDGFKNCSIWMPIDVIPRETSLKFIKGSHTWDRWFIPRKFATENNYPIIRESRKKYEVIPDIEENSYEILSWELEPGDCIVFHMLTIHGAAGNQSSKRHRRVLSTRWLGDDVTFTTRPWTVSPTIDGGLKPGDLPHLSESFPLIWRKE